MSEFSLWPPPPPLFHFMECQNETRRPLQWSAPYHADVYLLLLEDIYCNTQCAVCKYDQKKSTIKIFSIVVLAEHKMKGRLVHYLFLITFACKAKVSYFFNLPNSTMSIVYVYHALIFNFYWNVRVPIFNKFSFIFMGGCQIFALINF